MEKRLSLLLVSLFLFIGTALAQTKITGTVLSQDDGLPVIGASVIVQGTKTGTQTDIDGKFTLDVPAGKKLIISYWKSHTNLTHAGKYFRPSKVKITSPTLPK